MDWISEEVERQRRADQVREAEREAKIKALLEQDKGKNNGKGKQKAKDKNMRRALGSKLIEWGEQLQDGGSPNPSTLKI